MINADRIFYENSLTEDEAKTKWCPMARVPLDYGAPNEGGSGVSSGNRGWAGKSDPIYGDSRCIGSACMFWRWADRAPNDVERGYCGMAAR